MATYKCRSCGHEVISEKRPSDCGCCSGRDFFIEHAAYENLIFERSRLETKVTKIEKLETEKSNLEKTFSELQAETESLRAKTISKVKLGLLTSIPTIIAFVLGIFCYSQYQKSYQLRLKNAILADERQEAISEVEKLDKKLNRIEGKLSPGAEFIYQGSLYSRNSQKTYPLLVERGSRFDVELYDLSSDADLEIIKENGYVLPGSRKTSSGTNSERLNNFYISSGSYYIRIWLYSGESTSYNLRVYKWELL